MALALQNSLKLNAYGRIKDRYNSFLRESAQHKECVAKAKSKGKQPKQVCLNNRKNAVNHRQEAREIYIKHKDKFSGVEVRHIQSMLSTMDRDKPTAGDVAASPSRGVGTISSSVRAGFGPTPRVGVQGPVAQQIAFLPSSGSDVEFSDPDASLSVEMTGEPTFDEYEEQVAAGPSPLLLVGGGLAVAGLAYYFVFRR